MVGARRFLTTFLLGMAGTAASACGPYSVALYEYGALYYKDSRDGSFRGIDSDLVSELAQRSGCRLDAALESRVRTWARFAEGRLDIAVSALPLPEREAQAEFIPYLRSRQFVLMSRELAARLPTPEAFLADPQRRLIVVRGFRFTPRMSAWVEQLRAGKRIVESPDHPTALRVFRAGRADAVIVGASTLALQQQHDPQALEGFVHQSWSGEEITVAALALSRKTVKPADAQLLRRTLDEMIRDGSVDAILRRHVGEGLAALMANTGSAVARPVATGR